VLVTLDVDFANIQAYPPAVQSGIIVLRLASQSHSAIEAAIKSIVALLERERIRGTLWIVEENRIRIRE
jgi:predicted nuclease of predicted toxin-antitoxin system